jgi:hypothetical protein
MQREMNSCAAIYFNKIMCTPAAPTHSTQLGWCLYVSCQFNLQPSRLVSVCVCVCMFIQMAGTHTSALLDNPRHKSCSALIYMAACWCWLLQSLLVCRPTAARRSSIPHVLDFCREHRFQSEFRTYTHFSCESLMFVLPVYNS